MVTKYLILALRILRNNRLFTIINLLGLSVSVASSLVLLMYVSSELSFDKFHTDAKNIYRITTFKQTSEAAINSAQTAAPVLPAMKADFNEIVFATRLMKTEALMRYEVHSERELELIFADPEIGDVFSLHWIAGNAETSLSRPNSIVLTDRLALKYFQSQNPIGKEITLDGHSHFTVTGVVAELPVESHFSFSAILSMSTAEKEGSGDEWLFKNWYSESVYSYIKLDSKSSADNLLAKFPAFAIQHRQPNEDAQFRYGLEPLTDIYLRSKLNDQFGRTGNVNNVYALSLISLFIIVIAGVNFVNLTTGQAVKRFKEIGIRKVTGATLLQLKGQFIVESLILTVVSTVIGICLCDLILPFVNTFSGKSLALNYLNAGFIPYLVAFMIVISLLAAYYPAFVVTRVQAVKALNGSVKSAPLGLKLREFLVVIQFALSAMLVVCSLVVFRQLQYVNQIDLGFDKQQILVVNTYGDRELNDHMETFKDQLLKIPGVEKVSASSRVPGDGKSGWSMNFNMKGNITKTEMPVFLVDQDYLDLYKIPIVAGRNLQHSIKSDVNEALLLSESAVASLGFRANEEALGTVVDMYPSAAKVVGVFKDFNYESLHNKIDPLAMRMVSEQFRKISLKTQTSQLPGLLKEVSNAWTSACPGKPFEYTFLDEAFDQQYRSEQSFGTIFLVFTTLAISIASMGLYALSLINTQHRRKEIGIRKIVGASSSNLIVLLTKDYLKLIGIALFVAFPISFLVMNGWLKSFSYKISIGFDIFLIASGISMTVAALTVIAQTLRTTAANPVDSIRS